MSIATSLVGRLTFTGKLFLVKNPSNLSQFFSEPTISICVLPPSHMPPPPATAASPEFGWAPPNRVWHIPKKRKEKEDYSLWQKWLFSLFLKGKESDAFWCLCRRRFFCSVLWLFDVSILFMGTKGRERRAWRRFFSAFSCGTILVFYILITQREAKGL